MSKLQVKKSNFLVPLEEAVSKPAQLLASYLVASLPKSKIEDDLLPQLSFPYVEIRRAINADGKERVNKIQDVIDLGVELQKCILFYEDNMTERTVSWLIEQSRNKKNNEFTYTLHPGLKKYLVNIENHFTKYNYLFRVCLNPHAMKLYEILKMFHYKGSVTMNIEEDIKPSLGLSGKYPKIYDFKRRVINIAQKEIKQFTDIRFEYTVADKKGKTPISFRFDIYANSPTDLPQEILDKFKAEGKPLPRISSMAISDTEIKTDTGVSTNQLNNEQQKEIYETLQKWGGADKSIMKVIGQYSLSKIGYQIVHLKRLLKEGKKIDNKYAWFKTALDKDYQDAVQDVKEKKKQKQKVTTQKLAVKEQIEEEVKALKKEYYQKQKAICDDLIQQEPELLAITVESLRGNIVLKRAFREGKTPQEMYENQWTCGAIQNKLSLDKTQYFEKVKNYYLPRIAELENQLIS